MFSAFAYSVILSPKHLPRLAATLGLFTNYGLREFAKRQGLLNLQGADLVGLWMVGTILIQDRRSRRRKGKS